MPPVSVLVLHPDPPTDAGPLVRSLGSIRRALAERHVDAFAAAGAAEVRLVAGPPDDTPFGARLRSLSRSVEGGLIVLGSGAVPLATLADRRWFVDAAASGGRVALANDRYSADIVAVGDPRVLDALPDLDADNALPRWLTEVAGVAVMDLRDRWHLGVDLDTPADAVLAATDRRGAWLRPHLVGLPDEAVANRRAAISGVLADRRAEIVVAGRTSVRSLAWLERATACRVRALVEERGLRAASALAQADPRARVRPPASVLGRLLEHEGPAALGEILGRLGDAAVIDSRVLLAHRLGADERAWPSPEDRFASDLLDPSTVVDPWLQALTAAAHDAAIPILLGGHTLVGPGLRLLAGAGPAGVGPGLRLLAGAGPAGVGSTGA